MERRVRRGALRCVALKWKGCVKRGEWKWWKGKVSE